MFWFNFPYPISPFLFSQPIVRQVSQTYIDLDNIPENERVNIYTDDKNQIAEVQKFDSLKDKWITEYKKNFDKYSETYAKSHFWKEAGRNVLLITNTTGSGNYLTYLVLDRKSEKLETLLERSGIFQGQVWFEDDDIIEGEGNRFKKWKFIDGKFVLKPYKIPIVPNAKVLRYSISPDGTVKIINNITEANVGDMIQLIRADNNDVDERILYMDGSQSISLIPHRSAFKINNKADIEIDIIPFGYNWSKARKILIHTK